MLNPEVLKCHEDLITLEIYVQQRKTMDNKFFIHVCKDIKIFGYMGASGGRGGDNNQIGPILIHIYPLFNINFNIIFFAVMLGPYIQSRGTRGT